MTPLLPGRSVSWKWGLHLAAPGSCGCKKKQLLIHNIQPVNCAILISHLLLPFLLLDLSSTSSVGSWMYSICGPQLSSAHACTWNSMCLSMRRFKMGQLILSKWQVCLLRWEGMTFLPRATASLLASPTKEYFNRRLMEGTRNKKKTLSSLFPVLL